MRVIAATWTVVFLASLGGCATTKSTSASSSSTPQELVDARSSYERAAKGPAAQLDPRDLEASRQTLAEAESSFAQNGASLTTRDLALRAQRRAELAEARALTKRIRAFDAENGLTPPDEQTKLTSAKLQTSPHGPFHVNETSRELDKFAWVTSEPRGMVIRVPADKLFNAGESDLTPAGDHKLNRIARAINREGDVQIAIESHTDNQESAVVGGELSEHRADAIRDYFAKRGISPDRVSTHGFGASRPMTTNDTPSGRAENRRIEIIVRSQ